MWVCVHTTNELMLHGLIYNTDLCKDRRREWRFYLSFIFSDWKFSACLQGKWEGRSWPSGGRNWKAGPENRIPYWREHCWKWAARFSSRSLECCSIQVGENTFSSKENGDNVGLGWCLSVCFPGIFSSVCCPPESKWIKPLIQFYQDPCVNLE